MRVSRQSTGQIITLDPAALLGSGGEAHVYKLPNEPSLVAKIYHKPTPEYERKLVAMLANPPHDSMAAQGHASIAWPVELLQSADGKRDVIGFLMPRVSGLHPIIDFYNPGTRKKVSPLFNPVYLHRTARNLAAAMRALHERGYVVGDVNESNILVANTSLVTLVDTDSFQVREPNNGAIHRCPVGKPEFTPPELQGVNFRNADRVPEHDLFGLAVLIFQLLMEGTHPFAGVYTGHGDAPPQEKRIEAGHFPLGNKRTPYRPTKIAPPFDILHPDLQDLFVRCFEDGHTNPKARPSAQQWQNSLEAAEKSLTKCSVNDQHSYSKHLGACPWCERTQQLNGRDPFPSSQSVKSGQHLPSVPSQQMPLPSAGGIIVPPRPVVMPTPPVRTPTPQPLPRPVPNVASPAVKTPAQPKFFDWADLLLDTVPGVAVGIFYGMQESTFEGQTFGLGGFLLGVIIAVISSLCIRVYNLGMRTPSSNHILESVIVGAQIAGLTGATIGAYGTFVMGQKQDAMIIVTLLFIIPVAGAMAGIAALAGATIGAITGLFKKRIP